MVLSLVGGALAAGGCAYLGLALYRMNRGFPRYPDTGWRPPVTVLVPAHGAPARLEECLRSICAQDYPAMQVVFGVQSADDAAVAVIERVRADFPALDSHLVVDPRRAGTNPKNANLINMIPSAKHDVLVMIDSDVVVEPDFLAEFIRPLAEPGVGGVTSAFSGSPNPTLVATVGAMHHNDWFLPSVLVDLADPDIKLC